MEEMNHTRVMDFIDAIPETTCSRLQQEFLYCLSKNTTGAGEVVEIGTHIGKSTIAIAFARKEKNGNPIHTVDPFEHPDIVRNLEAAGVSEFVIRLVRRSTRAAKKWDRPIELLWIDGNHTSLAIAADIRAWSGFVIPGGKMAFHDYPGHRRSSEVWRALWMTVLRRPLEWRIVSDREAGSIIVLEKLDYRPEPETLSKRSRRRLYWARMNARFFLAEQWHRIKKS